MHRVLIITVAVWLGHTKPVEARLFRQTFGATVPTADGCVWNINQDYFVPRHDDSCRYGLFSSCKTSHTTSPASRRAHPLWPGYTTPYGPCRYAWRDHVYQAYCGCAPLAVCFKPWTALSSGLCRATLNPCEQALGGPASDVAPGPVVPELVDSPGVHYLPPIYYLPNVEPAGLEVLGTVAVDPEAVLVNNAIEEAAAAASGRAPAGDRGPLPPVGGVQLGRPE